VKAASMLPAMKLARAARPTHYVESGCGACGRDAVESNDRGKAWSIHVVPVSELAGNVLANRLARGLDIGSASTNGDVVLVLCPSCGHALRQDSTIGVGQLACSLLPARYGPPVWREYRDAARWLHAGRVVRARLLGKTEPTASATPWAHLPPNEPPVDTRVEEAEARALAQQVAAHNANAYEASQREHLARALEPMAEMLVEVEARTKATEARMAKALAAKDAELAKVTAQRDEIVAWAGRQRDRR
jgi:hypothetical protein